MQKQEEHIILKQTFELQIDQVQDHHEVTEKLKILFNNEILPRLSTVFDQLSGNHRIQIEKLEINIPALKMADWLTQLPDLMIRNVEQEIRAHFHTNQHTSDKERHSDAPQEKKSQLLEVFIHFCRTGSFPWWHHNDDFGKLENQLLESPHELLFTFLRQNIRNEEIISRFVFQFSEDFFKKLISKTDQRFEFIQNVELWTILISKGSFKALSESEISYIIKRSWLEAYLKHPDSKKLHPEEFISGLIKILASKVGDLPTDVALQLITALKYASKENRSLNLTKRLIEKYIQKQIDAEAITTENGQRISPGSGNLSDPDTLVKKAESPDPAVDLPESAYFISNAGLILLWPYLIPLFENIGLIKNKAFLDLTSQQTAVLVLQYLVDGQSCWNEHRLPLNKLLCAYPLWKTVPSTLELTKPIIHHTDTLLTAVIKHWSVLKGTSIDGLRHNFIKREGKLEQLDNRWKLSVNRKSYDLLLDQLPWTFRTSSLPWMEKRIQVDW